jgi:hypothetical protein
MTKTTKDGMVWYTQGELDAKIIIAEHDRKKQTLSEVIRYIEQQKVNYGNKNIFNNQIKFIKGLDK